MTENTKVAIHVGAAVFLWVFIVPIVFLGTAFFGAIKDWKNGNEFFWSWGQQEVSDDYSAIDWDREFEKIVLKPDNDALREYYEGIHLCRVGYEGVTQAEIKRIKLLLQ